jgi:hypothetical protein
MSEYESKWLQEPAWQLLDQLRQITPGRIGNPGPAVVKTAPRTPHDFLAATHDSPEYACGLDAALQPATERN